MAILLLLCMVFSACDVLFLDLAAKDPFEAGWDSLPGGSGSGFSARVTVTFDPNHTDPRLSSYLDSVTVPINSTLQASSLPRWYQKLDEDHNWTNPHFLGWNTKKDGTGDPFDYRTPVLEDMTVYAHWVEDSGEGYVEFKNDEGHQLSYPSKVPLDGDRKLVLLPAPPERHGWIFYGWYTQPDGKGQIVTHITELDGSIDTLYAHWIAVPHAVTYDLDGGTMPETFRLQQILEPDHNYEWKVTEPSTEPTRTGYNFVHWARVDEQGGSGDRWDFLNEHVEDHLTLRAVWNTRVYQLGYYPNGGSPASPVTIQSIRYDDPPDLLTPGDLDFSHSTLSFLNWNNQPDDNQWATRFHPGQSLALIPRWGDELSGHLYELYAHWGDASSGATGVSVYFNLNGGSMAEGQNHPAALNNRDPDQGIPRPPNDPQRRGYDFKGWYRIHNPDFSDHTNPDNQAWLFNDDPTPEVVGMNRTLFAGWEIREYSLSYDANAGTDTVTPPTAHTDIPYDQAEMIKGPDENARPGWRFLRWNTAADGSGQNIYAGQNMSALDTWGGAVTDLVLYAQWETLTYTVSYYSTGGTAVAARPNIPHDGVIEAEPQPTRTGYTFDGWHTKNGTADDDWEDPWVFGPSGTGTPVTGSITLFARWNPRLYTLHYDLNGGSGTVPDSKVNIQYNTFVDIAPSDGIYWLGFVFTGWNTEKDGSGVPFLGGQKDVRFRDHLTNEPYSTLYAQWTEARRLTVEFNTLGGTHVPYHYVSEDGGITAPSSPSLAGFTFGGWYTDITFGTAFDFEVRDVMGELTNSGAFTPVSSNITLVAKWLWTGSVDGMFTITFNANDGEFDDGLAIKTEKRFLGQTIAAPDDPERDTDEFNGWFRIDGSVDIPIPHYHSQFTDNTPYDFNREIRGGFTLYARWVDTTSYFGQGTARSPFLVRTLADLERVGSGERHPDHPDYPGGPTWDLDKHYRQMNNLPESGNSMPGSFSPIGSGSGTSSFHGVYDGNGFSITGLEIDHTSDNIGLFGYIDTVGTNVGTVRNLGLEKVHIRGTGNNMGSLAGTNHGIIENSYVNGGTVVTGNYPNVGGLVGDNRGTISESYVIMERVTSTSYALGGLVGQNRGTITNTYAAVDIVYTTNEYAGGLVGRNGASSSDRGTIQFSYATAHVSGRGDSAGLVGYTPNGDIQNSVALNPNLVNANPPSNTLYRIYGNTNGNTIANNFARNMVINGNVDYLGTQSADTTPTGQHGSSIMPADAANRFSIDAHLGVMNETWWGSNPGFDISSTVNGPSVWQFHPGGNADSHTLPTLRKTGGDQEPKMQEIHQGSGESEDDPFLVYDVPTLQRVGRATPPYANWTLSAHYLQIADIDMAAAGTFTPIAHLSIEFDGVYEGGGHTISNLTVSALSGPVGLFATITNDVTSLGIIRNLGLVDVNASGPSLTGALVGANYGGTIINCFATGTVTGTGTTIGGLVGRNEGKIEKSYANMTNVVGSNYVGGLSGVNASGATIQNSYAIGTVTNNGTSTSGGLVGRNEGEIVESYAQMENIIGNTSSNVGGLVGSNGTTGTILNSYAAVKSVSGFSYVGGVVGENEGTIDRTYATAVVAASYLYGLAGGVVGYNRSTGIVRNSVALNPSVARGAGSGSSSGRIYGTNEGTLSNNWARGNMRVNGSIILAANSEASRNGRHGMSIGGLADVGNDFILTALLGVWWYNVVPPFPPLPTSGPEFSRDIWEFSTIDSWISHKLPTLRETEGDQNPRMLD